ncbi:MAG: hypothetical protein JRI83_13825 [Deltaproteobacteria bacterium]|nr:hypothetical protein [Deltaproteobacteria bacterium]
MGRNLLLKICANIIDFIKSIVFSEDFRNRHRRLPQHFTRNRCLLFYSLVFFLIQSLRSAYQSELDRFFKILYASNVAKRVVTKAAFTKARMNLRFEASIIIWADFLYHLRWPVEEDYKAIKCRIDLENFFGKSALSVYQDFHAKVLMKNLDSLFALPVNDTLTETLTMRQHDYQVNFTQAVSTCRDIFILLFHRSKRKAQTMIRALLDLLKKTIEPIRSGRKCSRNHRVSSRKFYLAYKPCA